LGAASPLDERERNDFASFAKVRSKVDGMKTDELSTTFYTDSGGLSIAYQILGKKELNLLIVPAIISHIEFLHEFPEYSAFMTYLSEFSRVITFDKSGQGLSDRPVGFPSLEQRMDDIHSVLNATYCSNSVLIGCSEGASLSVLYAATHPERVSHLILFGGFARFTSTPDYPYAFSEETLEDRMKTVDESWGRDSGAIRRFLVSSMSRQDAVAQFAKLERLSASPGAYKASLRLNALIDIRPILATIQTPTLVMHRRHDASINIENGRYLAAHIPGAKFIEYDDTPDHLIYGGDARAIATDIREFVVGSRAHVEEFERVLATVLLVDIVGSTDKLKQIGDRSWARILEGHDKISRSCVEEHRGRFISTTGDGFIATFDSPSRAVRCAESVLERLQKIGLQVRVGIHTGEIELRGRQIAGIGVHIAARIMALAQPGKILVSRVLVDLIGGSGLKFENFGEFSLKGIDGTWALFLLA
jgi:class 3 adenylate cyclase